MSGDGQARFSKPLDHIFLDGKERKRAKKPIPKKKGKRPFPERSTVGYAKLSQSLSKIRNKALARNTILEYPRIHFIIEFSDALTWKPVIESIMKLELSIVRYIDDRRIRVSISKDKYEEFVSNLEKHYKYIQNIREITFPEKIDEKFLQELSEQPQARNWVSIELTVEELEQEDLVEKSLGNWMEKSAYGSLTKSYESDTMILLSGLLVNKSIGIITEELEPLSYVSKIPRMELRELDFKGSETLSSIIPLGKNPNDVDIDQLPSVLIIDSGINENHNLLMNYIEDKFDYSTGTSSPCTDSLGHGSSVAGLAIYGADLTGANSASARIIMIKNFERGNSREQPINHDVLSVIRESIEKYRFNSRVLNLSFNGRQPNQSWTKALDELIFTNDKIVGVRGQYISK